MVCIFVASKFHEVEPISILELQTLAEGGYTESSIRKFFWTLLHRGDEYATFFFFWMALASLFFCRSNMYVSIPCTHIWRVSYFSSWDSWISFFFFFPTFQHKNDTGTLELDLLTTLEWNMNPITTHHIMRHVANYLPVRERSLLIDLWKLDADVLTCAIFFIFFLSLSFSLLLFGFLYNPGGDSVVAAGAFRRILRLRADRLQFDCVQKN